MAKIADFGTTTVVRETIHVTCVSMSPNWCAPEYLYSPNDPKPSADVWSVGMVLYEMCTGTVPFNEGQEQLGSEHQWRLNAAKVTKRLLDGERPRLPATVDPQCARWMAKCWLPAPSRDAPVPAASAAAPVPEVRIEAKALHEEVKASLTRECQVCDVSCLLGRGGAQCEAGAHVRCCNCLQRLVDDSLFEGPIRPNGALPCKCGVYPLTSFRDLLPAALADRWLRATTVQEFVAGEQAQRDRRRDMAPVDREVERIQRKVLACACPHCSSKFLYEGANECLVRGNGFVAGNPAGLTLSIIGAQLSTQHMRMEILRLLL